MHLNRRYTPVIWKARGGRGWSTTPTGKLKANSIGRCNIFRLEVLDGAATRLGCATDWAGADVFTGASQVSIS